MSSPIVKKLLLLSGFCCALEVLRLVTTGTLSYIFLPANLFLAWIPLGFAVLMNRQDKILRIVACFLSWLVFFPNAPYIITDLVHLKPRNDFPVWFDSILIYSFAFTGLVIGMLSALLVYKQLKEFMSRLAARAIMLAGFYDGIHGTLLPIHLAFFTIPSPGPFILSPIRAPTR